MLMKFRLAGTLCGLLAIFFISSCKKDDFPRPDKKVDIEFYALSTGNQLIRYNARKPSDPLETITINGLSSGEKIIAIDFRPATGQLYGVSNNNRIYVLNQFTGASTAVGTSSFSPALNSDIIGFDFNPTVDRIRLVSASGQNLRLNPETGSVGAVDGNLNPGNPMIGAVAYTNNFSGAVSTILYDIDAATDKLFRQDPPNAGTLAEVGALGEDIEATGGFDISPDNKIALAALKTGKGYGNKAGDAENSYRLYLVDLEKGKLSRIGKFDREIIGLAIPAQPVAYATDAANNLWVFNPNNVVNPISKPITGLQPGEKILGIDMRPATSQLYAVGSSNRLYTINMSNGVATSVGSGFTPALQGTSFGFDFNPTVDRIRLVSNTGQNLRLNPITGTVAAIDGNINPVATGVDAVAYTNNFAGATNTTLYDIDYESDQVFVQTPPNNGTLVLIGAMGVRIDEANGFDIGGTTGTAYAVMRSGNKAAVYTINLLSGRATKISDFPLAVSSFAVGLGF